jgi:hypothetical protein
MNGKDAFHISMPQYPAHTHYNPQGNGDVPVFVLHQNIRLRDITLSDILCSDHLPVIFHILDHFRATDFSNRAEKFTGWSSFRDLPLNQFIPESDLPLVKKEGVERCLQGFGWEARR